MHQCFSPFPIRFSPKLSLLVEAKAPVEAPCSSDPCSVVTSGVTPSFPCQALSELLEQLLSPWQSLVPGSWEVVPYQYLLHIQSSWQYLLETESCDETICKRGCTLSKHWRATHFVNTWKGKIPRFIPLYQEKKLCIAKMSVKPGGRQEFHC